MGGTPLDYLRENAGEVTSSTQKNDLPNDSKNRTSSDDQNKFVAVVLGDTEDV